MPKIIKYEIKERAFIGTPSLHIATEDLNALPKVKLNDDGKEITFLEYLEAKGVKAGQVISPLVTQADSSIPIKAGENIEKILQDFVNLAKTQDHDIGFQDTKTDKQIVASALLEQIVSAPPAGKEQESILVSQSPAQIDEVAIVDQLATQNPEPGSLQLRFATTQDSKGNNWVLINREDFNLLAQQDPNLLNESEFFKELKQSNITTADASEASRDQPIAFKVKAPFKVEDIAGQLKSFAQDARVECNPISVQLATPSATLITEQIFATLPPEISGKAATAPTPSAPPLEETVTNTNAKQYSILDLGDGKSTLNISEADYINLKYKLDSDLSEREWDIAGHLGYATRIDNQVVNGVRVLTFATADRAKVEAALQTFADLAKTQLAKVDALPATATTIPEQPASPPPAIPTSISFTTDEDDNSILKVSTDDFKKLNKIKVIVDGNEIGFLDYLKHKGVCDKDTEAVFAGKFKIQLSNKDLIQQALQDFAGLARENGTNIQFELNAVTLSAIRRPTAPLAVTNYQIRLSTAQDDVDNCWLFINPEDYDKIKPGGKSIYEWLKEKGLTRDTSTEADKDILPPVTAGVIRIALKDIATMNNIRPICQQLAADMEQPSRIITNISSMSAGDNVDILSNITGVNVKRLEEPFVTTPVSELTRPTAPPATGATVNFFMDELKVGSKKINALHINLSDYNDIKDLKITLDNGKKVDLIGFLQYKKLQLTKTFSWAKPSEVDGNFVIPLSNKCTTGKLVEALYEFAAKANIKFNETDPTLESREASTDSVEAPVTPTAMAQNNQAQAATAASHAQPASVVATSTPNPGLHQPGSQTFMDKYKTAVAAKAAALNCTPNWSTTPYTIQQVPKTLGTLNHDAQKQSVTCAMAQNLNPAETQVMAQIHAAGLIAGFKKDDPITLTFAGDPDQAKVLAEQMLKDFHAHNPNRAIEIACADTTLKAAIEAKKATIYGTTAPTQQSQAVIPANPVNSGRGMGSGNRA